MYRIIRKMTATSLARTAEKRYNYPVSRCGIVRERTNGSGNPEGEMQSEKRLINHVPGIWRSAVFFHFDCCTER